MLDAYSGKRILKSPMLVFNWMVFNFFMSLFSREKMSGGSIILEDIKAVFVVATSWSTTEPSTSHEPGEAEGSLSRTQTHRFARQGSSGESGN